MSTGRLRRAGLQLQQLEDRRTPATALLPDLTIWADQSRGYMYDWYLDSSTTPGRTLLRLSNAVPNIGAGPLEIRGGAVNPDGTQVVYQRIYDDAGGSTEREAGSFVYHAAHGHIHFEDFVQYNLRAVTAGDGVGSVIAAGSKTSFRLEDTTVYNSALPGYSSTREYYGDHQVQGISVGWADVYHRNLAGQWIDVTGVAAGTYWLESVADPENNLVESNETNNATRIKITIGGAGAPDYAGNTLATARNVGALGGNQTFQDFVSPADANDYYRFTLGGTANFTLRLDGLSADADVQLLNSGGRVVARSTAGGANPEAIAQSLTAGTYYIRVYPYGGANTPYVLNMAAGSISSADGAGNTVGTARDIGDIAGTQTFGDAVGPADTDDYYRFRATGAGDVAFSLRLDRLTGDAGVELLDDEGVVIASSTNAGTTAETLSAELHSGHAYYVRVYSQAGGDAGYTLTLTGASTATDGAGNTLETARDIGTLTTSQTLQDQVSATDANDYYRFALGSQATLSLRLDNLAADADVQLLNSAGTVVARSVNSNTTAETISQPLAAGTYYVRVYPYGSATTNYNLTLSQVAAPPAPVDGGGNTIATATDIGTLASSWSIQDGVSPTDTNDYYRFTLASAATVSLQLTGLTADADVHLLNSSGTVIARSANWGTSVENISQLLAAGTYYVRVYPYGSVSSSYRLSLNLA